MPHRTLAPLALLGLAACGRPLLSAEVVVERFCFTQSACSGATSCLPPIPLGGTGGSVLAGTVSVPLKQNLPPLLRDRGDVVVRLLDARVTPTAGTTDLGGIQTLDLRVLPPAGPAVPVAHYARQPGVTPGVTPVPAIDLAGQGVDVTGYLQSGNLQMQVAITADGPPPGVPWSADLQVCFYGKTVVSYL